MDVRTGFPVVGLVGGGAPARMAHSAAMALGQSLRVLAGSPDDPAAAVVAGARVGDLTDIAVLRDFAAGCDVVTCGDDRVPVDHLRMLAAGGVAVLPGPDTVDLVRDRHRLLPERPADAASRILVALVARSPFGQVAVYPVVEDARTAGYWRGCRFDQGAEYVLAPAPGLASDQALRAQRLAIDLAASIGVVGVFAVEFAEFPGNPGTAGGTALTVTDLVLGPHEVAQWTVEGARTSAFEQHLRAVLDYPLGDTRMAARAVVTMRVVAGARGGMPVDERLHHAFAAEPSAKVHLSGVPPEPGRTIGHVTVLGEEFDDVIARAARVTRWLREGHDD